MGKREEVGSEADTSKGMGRVEMRRKRRKGAATRLEPAAVAEGGKVARSETRVGTEGGGEAFTFPGGAGAARRGPPFPP